MICAQYALDVLFVFVGTWGNNVHTKFDFDLELMHSKDLNEALYIKLPYLYMIHSNNVVGESNCK